MRGAYRIIRLAALCAALLALLCAGALADETLQVSIPVMAAGHGCTVELYDEGGSRVQVLSLQPGVESAFTVQCTGLQRFTYNALVADEDDGEITYDRRNYRVLIDLILDGEDRLSAMIHIEDLTVAGRKLPVMLFDNGSADPGVTPAPTPAPTLMPSPTPTPELYHHRFTFTKQWQGDREDSIDWVMYNPDGTQLHKRFNKRVASPYEWHYEAYFPNSVEDCYIIETPPEGYAVYYRNVGAHSHVTDRCYSGGTIINYRVPQTGDDAPVKFYSVATIASLLSLALWLTLAWRRRRT